MTRRPWLGAAATGMGIALLANALPLLERGELAPVFLAYMVEVFRASGHAARFWRG